MANYYVSANRGSDSTGVGSATNPWKTIGKAIGPTPAITLSGAGDALYVEPGVYRESVTLGLSPTPAGRLRIIGDCDGAGFLAGGYATPATGLVDWRAWTDDLTPIAGSCLAAASKSYVTLDHLKLIGGATSAGACVDTATCHDWAMRDCQFIGYGSSGMCCQIACAALAALNLTIDRCVFLQSVSNLPAVRLFAPLASADWSLGVTITNCYLTGGGIGVQLRNSGGTGTFVPGGVAIQSCTFAGLSQAADIYRSQSITILPASPVTIYGCLVIGGGLFAGAMNQLIEDGNIILSATPRTGVATGAHSVANACPALDFGDGLLTGLPLRPYGTPSGVGAIGAWGNYGTAPTLDLTGRNRPEGTGSTKAAAGALERHDTGAKDVSHQDAGSPACMALVGPSSQDRPILINAQPTSLSIKVRWDGNHGDAAKPQAILLANPEVGVAAQTVTATSAGGSGGSPNAYEVLTFSSFTPTAPGVVMLRMVSRAAAGNGAAYFDTITLS